MRAEPGTEADRQSGPPDGPLESALEVPVAGESKSSAPRVLQPNALDYRSDVSFGWSSISHARPMQSRSSLPPRTPPRAWAVR